MVQLLVICCFPVIISQHHDTARASQLHNPPYGLTKLIVWMICGTVYGYLIAYLMFRVTELPNRPRSTRNTRSSLRMATV